ncbi:MAG: hypothetical protein Q4A74_04960 [Cardiobacteriaceae bacterium]|nr:hypothetical protein [Cardiobacteriaceae bacterium]
MVGLQIASIYSLLPFYHGEHGEHFEKPALNLLKSAWVALHQKDLQRLQGKQDNDESHAIIENIRQRAQSRLGVAITQVLLAVHPETQKILLRKHPEVFPNLCLCGMDFHLAGIDSAVRERLFVTNDLDGARPNATGMQLQGANLEGANLVGAITTSHQLTWTEETYQLFQERGELFYIQCLIKKRQKHYIYVE